VAATRPAPGAFGAAPWRVLLSRHALAQLTALDLHLTRAAVAALAVLAAGRGWATMREASAAVVANETRLLVADVAVETSAVMEVAPHCVFGGGAGGKCHVPRHVISLATSYPVGCKMTQDTVGSKVWMEDKME